MRSKYSFGMVVLLAALTSPPILADSRIDQTFAAYGKCISDIKSLASARKYDDKLLEKCMSYKEAFIQAHPSSERKRVEKRLSLLETKAKEQHKNNREKN